MTSTTLPRLPLDLAPWRLAKLIAPNDLIRFCACLRLQQQRESGNNKKG